MSIAEPKKRELWADYAKGICILLVFVGHLDALPRAVRIFIYLFHMPMFFFCMGYYARVSGSLREFVKRRFRQLMVPYLVYTVGYELILYSMVFPFMNGEFDGETCLRRAAEILIQYRLSDFSSELWFLTAAFVACILFYLMRRYIGNFRMELIIVLGVSVVFVYLCRLPFFALPLYIDVAFPCLVFMYLGSFSREKALQLSPVSLLLLFLVGIACAVILSVVLSGSGERYPVDYHMLRLSPYPVVLAGGAAICLGLYGLLSGVKRPGLLSYIGENSIIYYLLSVIPLIVGSVIARALGIEERCLISLIRFLCILFVMPFAVMIIKYFFWFLFGRRRETWSFDYGRIFHRK